MTRPTTFLTILPLLSLLATVATEATTLAAPPEATALAQCKSVDCLRAAIPREKGKLLAARDCNAVEGRKDPLEEDLDLGPVCRVLVARAEAAFRRAAPCTSDGRINPDWDPALEDKYSLDLQSLQLAKSPFKRHVLTLDPGRHPVAGSTIFGTLAFKRSVADGGRSGEFATYFCIAGQPRRYVPYYYSLSIGDKIVEEQTVSKPDEILVLRQSRQFRHDDDQRAFVLADLNGDKKEDVAIVRRASGQKQYYLAACLFNPKGSDCIPVVAQERISIDDVYELHLEADKGGTLRLWGTNAYNKPVGEWRFRVVGRELKSVAK